jgi:hypothetical protein
VADALRRSAVETFMDHVVLHERVGELEAITTDLTGTMRALEAESAAHRDDAVSARADLEVLQAERELLGAELEVIRATRTWKLHDWLARHALVRRLAARTRPRR